MRVKVYEQNLTDSVCVSDRYTVTRELFVKLDNCTCMASTNRSPSETAFAYTFTRDVLRPSNLQHIAVCMWSTPWI